MRTTTKLSVSGAAVLLLGALVWMLLGKDPGPAQPTAAAPEITAAAPPAATSTIDAPDPTDPERVAVPDAAPVSTVLLHPHAYELEVQVQDRLGLPVEGARVLLAPSGCRLDEVAERTDDSGSVLIRWRGRSASMPMVVATRSDETREAVRQVVVGSGSRARVVFGGRKQQGASLHFVTSTNASQTFEVALHGVQRGTTGSLVLALDDIVTQQGIFADNPRMRDGLHPFASFGDVQWRQGDGSGPRNIEIGGLQGLRFLVNGTSVRIVKPQDAAEQPGARIEGFVYDETGKPCAKCPVAWGLQVDRPSQRTETDERGAFRFDDVAAGVLELRAGGSDAGLQHLTISTVHGQTTTTDVHLRRQASVHGRAVAADGTPLAGWRVEWSGTQIPWFDACNVTDDGSFVLPNLPGGSGRLLLWCGDQRLPVLQTGDLLPDTGPVELRVGAESGQGKLRIEPALPDGIDKGAVEIRVFQEDSGRGTTLRKVADSNQFEIADLAAGWYRLELGGPGLGWLDAGRHYVDGKSLVDVGRVVLPRAGSLRLHLPPDTELQTAGEEGGFVVEIYRRRDDCDVRLDDPATGGGEALPLPAGEYFAMWRSAAGAEGLEAFTVQAGRDVEVHCLGGKVPPTAADPAGERR